MEGVGRFVGIAGADVTAVTPALTPGCASSAKEGARRSVGNTLRHSNGVTHTQAHTHMHITEAYASTSTPPTSGKKKKKLGKKKKKLAKRLH